MPVFRPGLSAAWLALALALPAWPSDQNPVGNPVANPGFEDGSAGWTLTSGTVSREAPHAGTACLRLDRTAKGGGIALQFVTLEPETWYVCEFHYKLVGASGMSHVRIMGDVVDGVRSTPPQAYLLDRCDRSQWTRAVNHVWSDKGGRCEVEIRLHTAANPTEQSLPPAATLWVDSIVFRPMTRDDLKGELIENGGFEEGRAGLVPAGWSRGDTRRPGLPTVAATDKQAHGGTQALEIRLGPPPEKSESLVYVVTAGRRRIALGRPYTLSFWAKASRNTPARVMLSGSAPQSMAFELTPEWQRFLLAFTIMPEQQSAARQLPGFDFGAAGPLASGDVTLWYDDISLRLDGK